MLLTRQALFDSTARIYGFDFVDGARRQPGQPDASCASVATSFVDLLRRTPLDDLVGSRPAFLRVTTDFLASGGHRALPPGRMCLLVDAEEFRSERTREIALHDLLHAVRRDGYRVGLHRASSALDVQHATTSVDFMSIQPDADADQGAGLAAEARRAGVLTCARSIDSPEAFERVKNHFDVFHGAFYQRRSTATASDVGTGRLATLQLLAECANPDASLEDFEAIIGRDPSLTFRVMQLANSGYASLPRRLNSVREALITVGVTNIRNLAMIASLNRIEDQHPELLMNALVRAKICEVLARKTGLTPTVAFTAGLLSMLDSFLGVSLDEATERAALNDELRAAIVHHEGPMGGFVRAAVAIESADVDTASYTTFTADDLGDAYIASLTWAQGVLTNTAA